MENYNQEYDNPRNHGNEKSIKGLKIMIVILALILGALSFMYFSQVRSLREDFAEERDTLTNRITTLMSEYDNIKTENDTISQQLEIEKGKADSLLQQITKERRLSYAKIKRYEKELGTLRTVMRGYIKQIDSLNTMNQKLIAENVDYRKQVTSQRLRADMAEEKAQELSTKIRKGAVIRARDIALLALSSSDREVTRASRAARLRVDFVLSANELATPGNREVYARIIGPDGYVMASSASSVFDYEGDKLSFSASRNIDYQNQDLPVSVYYNGAGITGGKYNVSIFMDGYLIGSSEIILR